MSLDIVVYKCGGDIAKNPEHIRTFSQVVESNISGGKKVVLVHSGIRGVTDDLFAIAQGDGSIRDFLEDLEERHDALAQDLGLDDLPGKVYQELDGLEENLRHMRREFGGTSIERRIREQTQISGRVRLSSEIHDYLLLKNKIVVTGERLIAPILSLMYDLFGICSDDITGSALGIFTDHILDTAPQYHPGIKDNLIAKFRDTDLLVVTGFDALSPEGTATLGRSGSDKTATFLGYCLDAPVTLVKSTSGVMSSDPRIVASAFLVPRITYNEAAEAGNVQLEAVQYVASKGLPLTVESLDGEQTHVVDSTYSDNRSLKILQGYHNITQIEIKEIKDQPGAEEAVLDIFRRNGVNKLLSMDSVNSVSYILQGDEKDIKRAYKDLQLYSKTEQQKRFGIPNDDAISMKKGCLVLAIGDNMSFQEKTRFDATVSSIDAPIMVGGWREGLVSTYAMFPSMDKKEFHTILNTLHDHLFYG